jgi:putative hydrolase of the HAD superfamily
MTTEPVEIRALVLDYGEVLCASPTDEAVERLAKAAGTSRADLEPAYWAHRAAYDRGVVDGPGFWALVAGDLGTTFAPAQMDRLVAADTQAWTVLDPEMLDWAAGVVAAGVPVALLSNMVPEIGAHLRDELRLFDAFAHVAYSCELGVIKPEPAIYAHVLDVLSLGPEDVLFVDDREANVSAARELGWHAIEFRGRDPLMAAIAAGYSLR